MDVDTFTALCGPLFEATLLVSVEGAVLASNPAAAALCGRAELRDCQLSDLVLESSDKLKDYLERCAGSLVMVQSELFFRASEGLFHGCRVDGALVWPAQDDRPALLLLQCRDKNTEPSQFAALHDKITALSHEIAERHRAEAELYAQRESLHVILASIGDAVIATDNQGRVTFMNPIAEGLTGWQQDQAKGKPLREVFHIINHANRQPIDDPVSRVLQDGKSVGVANHTLLISRPGFERPIEDSAAPIRDNHGSLIGVVLVFRDASGRREQDRQAEALLSREKAVREQAQLANRIKDEFLATLSHELRTPLSAITGWVELLQHANLPPEQAAHGLEVIKRNVRAQTQLINDLLDVSRILSGKLSIESKSVNLIQVIAAALDSVQLAASAKGVSLRTHLNADASQVQGDPTRLQQILWNVLHNAIKFTPAGGWVDVRLELDGKSVQITVTDNGVGIESEFLPHLFERFRQADSTTTRRHGGLGLGLALVRELTELHGGLVVADSPGIGKGTTITIWLPQRTAPLAGRSIQSSPSRISEPTLVRQNRLTGLITLLVEDDDDSREIVAMLLASYGAEVIEARSAAEAMLQLTRSVPDVLVSDIGLPDEDGFSLIRAVRALPPEKGGAVPALALTAFARNVDSERALKEGFQLHLAKPAAPQELVDTIARLVGRC